MKMLNQSALAFKKRSKNMTDVKKEMEEKKSIREIEKHVKKCTKAKEDALRFKALTHKRYSIEIITKTCC